MSPIEDSRIPRIDIWIILIRCVNAELISIISIIEWLNSEFIPTWNLGYKNKFDTLRVLRIFSALEKPRIKDSGSSEKAFMKADSFCFLKRYRQNASIPYSETLWAFWIMIPVINGIGMREWSKSIRRTRAERMINPPPPYILVRSLMLCSVLILLEHA